ncbi:MAG: hypothetical protein ACPKPY_04330 [Nitrososphaeraceae archaeon]
MKNFNNLKDNIDITIITGKDSFIILLTKKVADVLKLENNNIRYKIQNGCLVISRKTESENDSTKDGGNFND